MMQTIAAIALWCATPTGTAEITRADVNACREKIFACLEKQGKSFGMEDILAGKQNRAYETCFRKQKL